MGVPPPPLGFTLVLMEKNVIENVLTKSNMNIRTTINPKTIATANTPKSATEKCEGNILRPTSNLILNKNTNIDSKMAAARGTLGMSFGHATFSCAAREIKIKIHSNLHSDGLKGGLRSVNSKTTTLIWIISFDCKTVVRVRSLKVMSKFENERSTERPECYARFPYRLLQFLQSVFLSEFRKGML